MTQFELLEFLNTLFASCEFNAFDIGEYQYKICDNSVRPRQFLSVNNEDEIEVTFTDREGHSLHKIINSDEPLRLIIDFNLLREVYDSLDPKLSGKEIRDLLISAVTKVCLEIFPKWDPETITIASSSDAKKMSLHILTFDMRLKNIVQVAVFTELIRKKLLIALQANSIINNIANKRSFFL